MDHLPQEVRDLVWLQYAMIEFSKPVSSDAAVIDPLGNISRSVTRPRILVPTHARYLRSGQLAASWVENGRARIFQVSVTRASKALFREFIKAVRPYIVLQDMFGDYGIGKFQNDLSGYYPIPMKLPQLHVVCRNFLGSTFSEREIVNERHKRILLDSRSFTVNRFMHHTSGCQGPLVVYSARAEKHEYGQTEEVGESEGEDETGEEDENEKDSDTKNDRPELVYEYIHAEFILA